MIKLKEQNQRSSHRLIKYFLFSLFISLVYFAIIYYTHIGYIIYDTSAMQCILSGDMSGVPNAHVMFSNYAVMQFLVFLYYILPGWNWYTIFLLFNYFFSLCVLLFHLLDMFSETGICWKSSIIIIVVLIFNCLFLEDINKLYCLTVASVSGIALVFYLCTTRRIQWYDFLICSVLTFLCVTNRFAVFEEFSPYICLSLLLLLIRKVDKKKVISLFFVIIVIVAGTYIIESNSYQKDYSSEKKINSLRSKIQDYGGMPDFEEHQDLYSKLDIDYDDYLLLASGNWGLSDHFNIETFEKIGEEKKNEIKDARVLLDKMFHEYYSWDFWLLLIILTIIVIFRQIKSGKKDIIILACFFAVAIAEIIYLVSKGRFPDYVCKSIVYTLLLTAIGLFIYDQSENKKALFSHKAKGFFAFLTIVILSINSLLNYNIIKKEYKEIEHELILSDYCKNNTENIYLGYALGEPTRIRHKNKTNHYSLSGWITETPEWNVAIQKNYDNIWDALAYRKDIRIIISGVHVKFLVDYMNKHGYNVFYESETIKLLDRTYTVYKIVNPQSVFAT